MRLLLDASPISSAVMASSNMAYGLAAATLLKRAISSANCER